MSNKRKSGHHYKRADIPLEWGQAVDALLGHEQAGLGWIATGKYDPQPLADLLRSGLPIPDEVSQLLGNLIDPPSGYIGSRLKLKPPGPQAKTLIKRRISEQKAYEERIKLVSQGEKFEFAVEKVAEKFNMSKSKVAKLKPVQAVDFIDELSLRLNSRTLLP